MPGKSNNDKVKLTQVKEVKAVQKQDEQNLDSNNNTKNDTVEPIKVKVKAVQKQDVESGNQTDAYTCITIKHQEATSNKPPLISYELFLWTLFTVIVLVAVIDRLTWNLWPRQSFNIGRGKAANDQIEGFSEGPWSVVAFDIIARVSGRHAIVCYNFLILSKLESLEYLVSQSFVARYLLDCTNIVTANDRFHKINGIGICVLTLLHVWSVFFPCIFNGYSITVRSGSFEWPISERTPVKCSKQNVTGCWPGQPSNEELKLMGLQADDVFRIIEMTLFLGILMPLCIKWLSTRWHVGIHLHRIINIVYFVDITRRHSHPHSMLFNIPMFIIYLIDKFVFRQYWNRNKNPEIKKQLLGKDFMVLYWSSSSGILETIGPVYRLRLTNSSFLESGHAFTCFQNRVGMDLSNDNSNSFEWNVGVVIRVFRNRRRPQLGTIDSKSHTGRMHDEDPEYVIMGPVQSEMSEKIRFSLLKITSKHMVVYGAGSAINFLIDLLEWCCLSTPRRSKLSLAYTTRDADLFKWAKKVIINLLQAARKRGTMLDQVTLAYTGPSDALHSQKPVDAAATVSTRFNVIFNRIDMKEVIPSRSTVFCQGSSNFKNSVEKYCKKVHAKFCGGQGGAKETAAKKNVIQPM